MRWCSARCCDSKDINYGYNALTDEYEDLVKAGVLDPTKVVRTALTNAGSIAALMLTTEALVAEIPEKKEAPMGGGGQAAAAWKACTKRQLSAISFQPSVKSKALLARAGPFFPALSSAAKTALI